MSWLANDFIDPNTVVPDDEDGDIEDSDENESTPCLNIDDDELEKKTEVKDFKKSLGIKKQVTSSKSYVPCPHWKEIFCNNYSLKRHLTRKHPSIDSSSIQQGNCMCLEPHCDYKCRRILELREHLMKRQFKCYLRTIRVYD